MNKLQMPHNLPTAVPTDPQTPEEMERALECERKNQLFNKLTNPAKEEDQ